MHSILSAGTTFLINRVAVLEVTYLVGEGDVVGMSGPRQSGVFTGGRIHGVEIGRQMVSGGVAAGPVGIVEDLTEAIGSARSHRSAISRSEVRNRSLQSVRRILKFDTQHIAGVVEEGICGRRECTAVFQQWAGRTTGHSAFRNEREVYRFRPDGV